MMEGGAEEVLLRLVDERDEIGERRGSRDEGLGEADGDLFKEGVEELVRGLAVVMGEGDDLEAKDDGRDGGSAERRRSEG